MKSSFEYTLKSPISVSSGSEQIDASDIVVKGPRPRDKNNAIILESKLTKALMKFSSPGSTDSSSDKTTEEDKIKGFKMVIMGYSDDEDLLAMVNILKDLMCEGNSENPQATIGAAKFTKPLFDEVDNKDTIELLARYSHHFLLSELMD